MESEDSSSLYAAIRPLTRLKRERGAIALTLATYMRHVRVDDTVVTPRRMVQFPSAVALTSLCCKAPPLSFSCSHFLPRLIFCKRVSRDRGVSIVAELAPPRRTTITQLQNVNLNLAPPALLHLFAAQLSTTCFRVVSGFGAFGLSPFFTLLAHACLLACLLTLAQHSSGLLAPGDIPASCVVVGSHSSGLLTPGDLPAYCAYPEPALARPSIRLLTAISHHLLHPCDNPIAACATCPLYLKATLGSAFTEYLVQHG